MMIKIERKDNVVEYMTLDEFSRWGCYVEAMEAIKLKAKELKMDYRKVVDSKHILNYIKERFPSIRHDVEMEAKLGTF
jgi:hypothetical protein